MELRIQNDHGVVLDPAWLGINLREGILRQRHDVAALVKNNRTGACGALIQSHNVTIHEKNLRFKVKLLYNGKELSSIAPTRAYFRICRKRKAPYPVFWDKVPDWMV